jgi:hypothetical protein
MLREAIYGFKLILKTNRTRFPKDHKNIHNFDGEFLWFISYFKYFNCSVYVGGVMNWKGFGRKQS